MADFHLSLTANIPLTFVIACAIGLMWVSKKSYEFSGADLIRLTQKNVGSQTFGQDHRSAFAAIQKELFLKHAVVDYDNQFPWTWLRYGGVVGTTVIIYSSITEFLAFYGTAVETTGLSPRCLTNFTATLVQGSVKVWNEGETSGKRFIPGETFSLPPLTSSAIAMDSSTWMLVHGRGVPVTCLPSILTQALIAFDIPSLFKLTKQVYLGFIYSYLPNVLSQTAHSILNLLPI